MNDATKNIEIAINITGAESLKAIEKITSALKGFKGVIDSTVEKIKSIDTELKKIKAPPTLTSLFEQLNKFSNIKIPNLSNIASGFEKLEGIKDKIPNLTPFETQLRKLDGIKLPNLKQIAEGLASLKENQNLSGLNLQLKTLSVALGQLKGITLPNLSQLANGLKTLKENQNLSGLNLQLSTLAKALNQLKGITLPNLGQIGSGLKTIIDTPLSGFASKVTTLETGLKRLALINLSPLATVIKGLNDINLNKAVTELKKVEKRIQSTGQTAQTATKRYRTFADAFRTISMFRVVAGILQTVREAITGGIKAIVEYDQALKDLQAITGATGNEVAQMGAKILEVASTTKFSATEVAEGMRIIGQAGFSAAEAIQTMQSVSDLATGTLSSMASTVDLVTTAMRVFQIDATNSQSVVDTFANAVNKSKLTIDKLRTAMNYVGPVAQSAGINVQELSAAMGTLANSGLRASTIGTGLRRVFAELVDPSSKMAVAARKAGVALNELDPNKNNLVSVLSNLRLVLDDSGTAFDIFGKRGAAAAIALVNNESGFSSMLDTVSKSGTAAKMASVQMEGLGVSFKNLKDRLGVLAVALGDGGITTAMRLFISVAKGATVVLTEFANSTLGKVTVAVGILTVAVGSLVLAFIQLGVAAKTVAIFTALAKGLAVITSAWSSLAAALFTTTQALSGALVGLLPWVAAIGAVIAVITLTIKGVKGNTDELLATNAKLAAEYKNLAQTISNYKQNIIGLDEGSKELAEANLTLRDSLLETKNEFFELTDSALAAAASINPVTGAVTDGGQAIDAYNQQLDELQFEKLVTAANLANKSLQEQTGFFSRLGNIAKDAWDNIGQSDEAEAAMHKLQKETTALAVKLTDGFEKAGISFTELGDIIKGWDHTKLTNQQKEIVTSWELINEQSSNFVEHLLKTNKVSLDNTVESFRQFASEAKITGGALDAVVEKLTILKKAQADSFDNVIEKWEQEDNVPIAEAIELYKELGGVVTEKEEAEAKSIEADKANLVSRLNNLKAIKEAELANLNELLGGDVQYYKDKKALADKDLADAIKNGDKLSIALAQQKVNEVDYNSAPTLEAFNAEKLAISKKYYAEEHNLIMESADVNKRASESTLVQNLSMLEQAQAELKVTLAQKAEQYKGNSDLIAKHQQEAIREYLKTEKELLKGYTPDFQEQKANYKNYLADLKVAHSEHLNELALDESKGLIDAEKFNDEKLKLNVDLYKKLLDAAQKHQDQVSAIDAPEEYKKRRELLLKAETAYNKALLKQTIDANKDAVKAEKEARKEKLNNQKLDYDETYAKIKKNHADFVDDLALQELRGEITSEEFTKQKVADNVKMYATILKAAKKHQNLVSKSDNPEEYKKRTTLVLKVEKNLSKAKLGVTKATLKAEEEALKESIKKRKEEYQTHLGDLKRIHENHMGDLALLDAQGLISSDEYKAKQLESDLKLAKDRLEEAKKLQEALNVLDSKDDKDEAADNVLNANHAVTEAELNVQLDQIRVAKEEEERLYQEKYKNITESHDRYINAIRMTESQGVNTNSLEYAAKEELYANLISLVRTHNVNLDASAEAQLKAQQDRDDQINTLSIQANQARVDELIRLEQEHIAKKAEILTAQTAGYEKSNQIRETSHANSLAKIAALEANGVLTHAQAAERKASAEGTMYGEMLAAAKAYYQQAIEAGEFEEAEDRYSEVVEAEEKIKEAKITALEEYNDAKEEHSEKTKEIEEDLADDIEEIQEKLAEKLAKIQEDIEKNNEKGYKNKVGYYEDAQDKIDKINQRGMTDLEKQIDNEEKAYKKLAKGRALVAAGAKSGDLEQIESGKKLIEQASDLSAGLEDNEKAKSGVVAAQKALNAAENSTTRIKNEEKMAKIAEEQATAKKEETQLRLVAEKAQEAENKKLEEAKKNTDALVKAIKESSEKPITVVTDKSESDVKKLEEAIAKIKSKIVTITVKVNKVEMNEIGGLVGAYAKGGSVEQPEHYANGGNVFKRLTSPFISRGGGQKDDVPAMLMKGEFVMKKSAVAKYGKKLMYMLNMGMLDNIPKFAKGGIVNNISHISDSLMEQIPKFKDGGIVSNIANISNSAIKNVSNSMNQGLRIAQLQSNPKAPFTHEGVTYNISAPSFYKEMDRKNSNISSIDGKKRSLALTKMFSNIIPKLQTGGSSDLLAQFHEEKSLIQKMYNSDIKYAQDSGDDETAYLLEMEKIQLEELAQQLLITLEQIRLDYEAEMLGAKDTLAENVADFQEESASAASDYRSSMLDLSIERAEIERNYKQEKYDLEHIGDRKLIGPNDAQQLKDLTADYKLDKQGVNSQEKAVITEYEQAITSAASEMSRTQKRYDSDETFIERQAKNDISTEIVLGDIESQKIKGETTYEVRKVTRDTTHEIQQLQLELQLELLELRKTYADLIKAESSAATSTSSSSSGSSDSVQVTHWLNKGGFVGYPKGKKRKKDDIGAMLTPGEFVMREEAVQHYGEDFMNSLNQQEVDPSYNDFPTSFVPKINNGVAYHVNAPSFHNHLAGKDFKTSVGLKTAKNLSNIFKNAVPHLATGGDIGTAEEQMVYEVDLATEEFTALIAEAKENGQDELAYLLEKEEIELRTLQEELQYTLDELLAERDYALDDLDWDFQQDATDQQREYEDDLADARKELAEINADITYQQSLLSAANAQSDSNSSYYSGGSGGSSASSAYQERAQAKLDLDQFKETHRLRGTSTDAVAAMSGSIPDYIKSTYSGFWDKTFYDHTELYDQELAQLELAYNNAKKVAAQETVEAQQEVADNKADIQAEIESLKSDRVSVNSTIAQLSTRNSAESGQLQTKYDYEVAKTNRVYNYETYKANREKQFEDHDVVFESEKDIRDAKRDLKYEIKQLEIEMAQTIFEIQKSYNSTGNSYGVTHFLNKGGEVGMPFGAIPGKDSVKALLTPGEFVMKESVVRKFGADFFKKLNNFQMPNFGMGSSIKRFAEGGLVNDPVSSISNVMTGTDTMLGTVNLQVGKNTYPVKANLNLAKQLISEFKRMGMTIA